MGLTKGVRRKRITTKRRRAKTKGRSRRGRGAGQSINSDKQLELMEEGKPWYTAPSKKGPIVDPNLNAAKLIQTENDNIDFEAAANQGLTFGGKKKSKRRTRRRRIKRTK
jgi:hypothetical protein